MRTRLSFRSLLLTASAITLLGAPAYAASYSFASPSLYEQMDGTIAYVTGGIGEAELAELELAKASYNTRITNTDTTGAYVSDTSVVIQDRKGRDILAANAEPLMFINLPVGRYKLLAENSGLVQVKNFTVTARKPATIHLTWNLPQ